MFTVHHLKSSQTKPSLTLNGISCKPPKLETHKPLLSQRYSWLDTAVGSQSPLTSDLFMSLYIPFCGLSCVFANIIILNNHCNTFIKSETFIPIMRQLIRVEFGTKSLDTFEIPTICGYLGNVAETLTCGGFDGFHYWLSGRYHVSDSEENIEEFHIKKLIQNGCTALILGLIKQVMCFYSTLKFFI